MADQVRAFRAPLIQLDLAGKSLPAEMKIFPCGGFETEKGPFAFDARGADMVLGNLHERGVDLPFDWNHGMTPGLFESVADPAEQGKAAGWFTYELRAGELWATNIRWTPLAQQKLKDLEYRYISPTFDIERTGDFEPCHVLEADGSDQGRRRVCRLLCVALTNIPAMHGLDPIVANAAGVGRQEKCMKTLLMKLGLSETATEAQAIIALEALQAVQATIFAVTGKATLAESIGVLNAWKANEAEVKRLSDVVAASEKVQKTRDIEDAIVRGKTEGKITPASEPAMRKLADEHGVKALTAFLSAAVSVPKPAEEPGGNPGAVVALSGAEIAAAKKFGRKPEDYAAVKKASIDAGVYPFAQ